MIRREQWDHLSVEYATDSDTKEELKQLKSTRTLSKSLKGKHLYDSLSYTLDMEAYYKWLAFNYLIMNGDYADELFLYLKPGSSQLGIIPWDYDDVFSSEPHEGLKKRDKVMGSKLLFSSEASFDRVIASDEYLYRQYLITFVDVLTLLTPKMVKATFERVYQELYPFYSNPEIIAQSQHDHYGLTDLEVLEHDLSMFYQFLVNRRNSVETALVMEEL